MEISITDQQAAVINELKRELWELKNSNPDGTHCPMCEQKVKRYNRFVHGSMASELVEMYRRYGCEWFDVKELELRGGSYAQLRYWGLLQYDEAAVREDGGRGVGRWRVTEKGELWVLGQVSITKYALIYNGKCEGYTGERWFITDALGAQFDYRQIAGR